MHKAMAIAVALFNMAAAAASSVQVVNILDGDTLDVLDNGVTRRIRLAHIDAPEKDQPYGDWSARMLSSLLDGDITVDYEGSDQYGRQLAVVRSNGHNVNLAMVYAGAAWQYRFDRLSLYGDAHRKARSEKKGLWSSKAIDPYVWRRTHK